MQGKERWLVISLMVLLLVVTIVVLPAATYEFRAKEIPFENLSLQTAYTSKQQTGTMLEIINSPTVVDKMDILAADQETLSSADYLRYFVVAIYFGFGGSAQSQVTKVAQFKDVVWLKSEFPNNSSDGEKFSPYQLIKIEKSRVQRWDLVKFKLVNEVFVDKAQSNQYNFPGP